jgi:hypothetical protein
LRSQWRCDRRRVQKANQLQLEVAKSRFALLFNQLADRLRVADNRCRQRRELTEYLASDHRRKCRLSPEKLIFSRAASLDVSYVMDPAYQRLEQLVSKRRYPRLNAVALDVLAMV